MLPNKHLIIAIDFDGTIVEDAYPKIGKPLNFMPLIKIILKKCLMEKSVEKFTQTYSSTTEMLAGL